MNDVPPVAIITVNYNGAEFIEAFARSIAAVEYPTFRLFAVDCASHDGSAELLERAYPEATVIRAGENLGITGGNNLALRHAREWGAGYALFLNNDTVVAPGFLRTLVACADERTMAVPKIRYLFDTRLISTHAGDFDWTRGVFRNTHHGQTDGPATSVARELRTASFCCMLIPMAVFDSIGDIDDAYFMYYDDTDFVERALRAGFGLVYEPAAVIDHRESGSSGGGWYTPFKCYYATRNRLYLMRKLTSRPRYALFTAYFWLTRPPIALGYALRGRRRLLRAMLLGMRDYYRGRMGRTLEVSDL